MLFDTSRESLRRQWLEAWRKARTHALLSPLESQLAGLLEEHPEYHDWLEQGESVLQAEHSAAHGGSNPFLHLSMHLALREQVATDRPFGISAIHARLASRSSAHDAEHAMMESLGQVLWEAQRAGAAPDEQRYLESLRRLLPARG